MKWEGECLEEALGEKKGRCGPLNALPNEASLGEGNKGRGAIAIREYGDHGEVMTLHNSQPCSDLSVP